MASIDEPVLVTGGSGFVALELISQLLVQGYAVHTTVRSLQNTAKVSCLQDLKAQHPEGRLLLFEADLLQPGSFHQAMQGCSVVFHVASPFKVPEKIKDGDSEMVQPALQGTGNVLGAVEDTPSVSRVVFTSTSESVPCVIGQALNNRVTDTPDSWRDSRRLQRCHRQDESHEPRLL